MAATALLSIEDATAAYPIEKLFKDAETAEWSDEGTYFRVCSRNSNDKRIHCTIFICRLKVNRLILLFEWLMLTQSAAHSFCMESKTRDRDIERHVASTRLHHIEDKIERWHPVRNRERSKKAPNRSVSKVDMHVLLTSC